MASDKIRLRATVSEMQRGGQVRCHSQDNTDHTILAHLSGKMQINRITLAEGDDVTIELSPYDLTRGRIVYRHD